MVERGRLPGDKRGRLVNLRVGPLVSSTMMSNGWVHQLSAKHQRCQHSFIQSCLVWSQTLIFLRSTKYQYLNMQVAEMNNSLLRCLVTNAKCTEQGERSKDGSRTQPTHFKIAPIFFIIYLFVQANSSGQHTTCVITIQNMQGQLFSTGCQNEMNILMSFI